MQRIQNHSRLLKNKEYLIIYLCVSGGDKILTVNIKSNRFLIYPFGFKII
jgi:hypothetical protein